MILGFCKKDPSDFKEMLTQNFVIISCALALSTKNNRACAHTFSCPDSIDSTIRIRVYFLLLGRFLLTNYSCVLRYLCILLCVEPVFSLQPFVSDAVLRPRVFLFSWTRIQPKFLFNFEITVPWILWTLPLQHTHAFPFCFSFFLFRFQLLQRMRLVLLFLRFLVQYESKADPVFF